MKKLLFKTLTVAAVIMMFACVTAFAADLTASVADNTLTVAVTGLTAGEESTLLVVEDGTKLADVASNTDKIFYVDQVTATDGTATYTIDVTDAGNIDVYSGYSTMAAGEDAMFDPVEEEGPVDEKVYGDANSDTSVDFMDAILVLDYELGLVADDEIDIVAADANADTSVDFMDAILILDFELGLVEKLPQTN